MPFQSKAGSDRTKPLRPESSMILCRPSRVSTSEIRDRYQGCWETHSGISSAFVAHRSRHTEPSPSRVLPTPTKAARQHGMFCLVLAKSSIMLSAELPDHEGQNRRATECDPLPEGRSCGGAGHSFR